MGGSSKKVTVGYRYFLGVHMILSHGPVDKLLQMLVDKRVAWQGFNSGGQVTISASNLFGGESREGGVSGAVDFETGAPTQNQNSYLVSKIGSDIPSFRGVAGVVLRQCYLGVNPYLKAWAFRLQRIHKRQDGLPQWNNAKSEIVVAAPYNGPQAYFFVIDASGSMNESDGSLTRMSAVKQGMSAVLDAVDENRRISGGVAVDVGVAFYSSSPYAPDGATMVRRNISTVEISELKAFINGITADGGTEPKYGFGPANSFFTGTPASYRRVCMHITDGQPLAAGYSEFTPEGVQQATNEALAAGSSIFASGSGIQARGINISLSDTTYSGQLDNTPDDGVPVVSGDPSALISALMFGVNIGHSDMNPAHIVRECLTDHDWGMGYSESDIDEDSFISAAESLYIEQMGMSLLWDRQTPLEDFIKEILRHIDATLYVDRKSGKFVLKLIRADYDEESLLVLGENEIERVENYSKPAFGEIINSVTINYWNYSTNSTSSITADDPALIQLQGAVIGTTIQYPGFSNGKIAARVAMRDLRSLSSTTLSCTIYANRAAANLNIGDAFLFEWPDYHEGGIVMRVTGLALGDGRSNKVRLTCTQDTFDLPDVTIISPEAPDWQDPSDVPSQADYRIVVEAPYYELVQRLGQTTADEQLASNPHIGYLLASAMAPSGAINARMAVNSGAGYTDGNDTPIDFCPAAFTGEDLSASATTVAITGGQALTSVTTGTHAQIGSELVKVVSVSDSSLTIGRGVLDTVPTSHAAGTPIFFWDAYADSDNVEYVQGEVLGVKLLPVSGAGVVELSAAQEDNLLFVARAFKPYAPGNFKINGTSYPATVEDNVTSSLTWSHRDRLQQTAGDIVDTTAGNIGPEAGVTYNLRIYGEDGTTLGRSVSTAGTSFDYTIAMEFEDFPGLGSLAPWTPSQIATSLWLDSDDSSSVILTSGAVSQWSDKSGNARHFTQSTAANRPVVSAAAINGKNAISFDGVNHWLTAASAIIGVTHSLYVVFKPTIESEVGALISQYAVSQAGRTIVSINQNCQGAASSGSLNPFNASITQGACTGDGDGFLQSFSIANEPTLFEWLQTTGTENSKTYKFGVLNDSGTATTIYSGVNTQIGRAVGGGTADLPYDGLIAEVVIASSLHDLDTRQKIEGYLAHKWGFTSNLPSDHPYKTTAPTVLEGDSRVNGRLRFQLESVRGEVTSYQMHDHTVRRPGYGFNYGDSYGD